MAALAATAADYDLTARRAARSFGYGEWAQAGALYELMLAERPAVADTYGSAIVAAELRPDSVRAIELLQRAQAHAVPLDSVVNAVRVAARASGHTGIYETFLLRMRRNMPYMSRAIDARLLDYYELRGDADGMVRISQSMLRGLPDSVRYLASLARGRLLQGDTAGAEEAWRHILALEPDNVDALRHLGTLLLEGGRTDEARSLLERVQSISPSPYLEKLLHAEH